jgi:hypothetical protein
MNRVWQPFENGTLPRRAGEDFVCRGRLVQPGQFARSKFPTGFNQALSLVFRDVTGMSFVSRRRSPQAMNVAEFSSEGPTPARSAHHYGTESTDLIYRPGVTESVLVSSGM